MPPDALEFATDSAFGEARDEKRHEVEKALRELAEEFGPQELAAICSDIFPANSVAPQTNREMLRAFTALVIESDRPALTVQLIARLCHLDIAAGKPQSIATLARAHGLTKQTVSAQLAGLAGKLHLPRPDSTEQSRERARAQNKRNYLPL